MRREKAQTLGAGRLSGQRGAGEANGSHTCYSGDREHRYSWGFGCGNRSECNHRRVWCSSWQSADELDRDQLQRRNAPTPAGACAGVT
ncbi:hypothetical protein DPM33_35305 [Mesorhizobium hawassense]|uniref:VPS37 C-terminal domain-containing protein n=1 Tax=Mesorhizobium hawassense TaxID=1209954 RepID=A0A330H192_9HYPH|nr:hypothetical protein [Mesorhizobium hawassense]RAZ82140.1 hypothetical protein DPM33_35305 [Mesorhizobium hawassense]